MQNTVKSVDNYCFISFRKTAVMLARYSTLFAFYPGLSSSMLLLFLHFHQPVTAPLVPLSEFVFNQNYCVA